MIVLDFSKAFDKVSHPRLLHKLKHYGVNGRNHAWISAFLNNRTQTVVLENKYSDKMDVGSGVPQGSVLRPVLFLIFIKSPMTSSTQTSDCSLTTAPFIVQ